MELLSTEKELELSKLKADDALKCIENYGEKDEIEIAMEIGPDLK